MFTVISILLVIFFLLMNAFFVIAEFALVRVRKSQIELAVEEKKPGARAAKKIAENINAYLSACQLGITLASLAIGWLGEPCRVRGSRDAASRSGATREHHPIPFASASASSS